MLSKTKGIYNILSLTRVLNPALPRTNNSMHVNTKLGVIARSTLQARSLP